MKPHLEVEAKYDVADGQPLPDLIGVGGIETVATAPEMVLTATYFDTAGHELSASGATLRRRSGGEDDGWHLKLSVADGERLEVHRPLGRGADPAGSAHLTRARPHRVPRARRCGDPHHPAYRPPAARLTTAVRLPSSPTTR